MSNSRTKNTLLNTIAGIFVNFVSMLASFATRTIFIRTLGMQYAGVSGVFTDILTVLSFAEMGIGSAIVYALYKPIAENDEKQIAKLMNAYKKIYTMIAFVIFALGICLIPFLKYIITDVPDIREDIRLIYVLYLLNTSTSYLLIYKTTFLTAAQKDYIVAKIKIIIFITRAVVDCILLLAFKNFVVYLLFSNFVTIAQNIIVARVAEREYPALKTKSHIRLERSEKTKLFNDVRALFLYKVSGTVLNGTDSLVISTCIETTLVGVVGNYNMISNQVYNFVMRFFTATSASIGNLAVTSSSEHQEKIFEEMLFLCFWIYCFCSTCLWVLFNPFMIVWQGEKYILSTTVVALLVVDFYMKGMLSPISQFRTSNGLFVQGKYRPLIMAIINIVVSIFLANKIGLAGVILGTIISRISTQLWFDPYLIYKYVFKKPVYKYFIKYIYYSLLTIFCCMLTSTFLRIVSISNVFLKIAVGAVLCVIIPNGILLTLFHRTVEFKNLAEVVKNIIKRKI